MHAHRIREVFGRSTWPKCFLTTVDSNNDYLFNTHLRQQGGFHLIEVSSASQSLALQDWLSHTPSGLTVTKQTILNSGTGTVVILDDTENSDIPFEKSNPLILENVRLSSSPITDITTYVRPPRNQNQRGFHVAKLTFKSHQLPDVIHIAGQQLEVRPYWQSPRRCRKCWKYGILNYAAARIRSFVPCVGR